MSAVTKESFEQGALNLLHDILKRPDINIKYEHNGSSDPFFTHTVTLNDKEIFYLKYLIEEQYRGIDAKVSTSDKSLLRIDGNQQDWSVESLEALHRLVDHAYWEQKRRKEAEKQQKIDDKKIQEQNKTISFLSNFATNERK